MNLQYVQNLEIKAETVPVAAVRKLEIRAARETSSIKVNDTDSQISSTVAAAVETNNYLPVNARAETLHHNRMNPKRRRLMESVSFLVRDAPVEQLETQTMNNIVIASVDLLLADPFVKKYVRKIFMGNATVSTSPTTDGNVDIDSHHKFAEIKWLRYKPLTKF
ncbi:hypothetical protein L6452_18934 [Arctium lappa]|uniref:Uncharacterized protein n=1 Tax=Arctium lappa TaxID=4217 RepID=A0ACB9B781_ARCLA|nr:hypothetical protein L6452_18934 [Arctium lappa]